MSQTLATTTINHSADTVRPSRLRLISTLLLKECRETGFYGLIIMALGIGMIWIVGTLDGSNLRLFDSQLVSLQIAKMFPVIFVLATASTSFAIEKENGAYQLIRTLPISTGMVLLTKCVVIIALTAVCAAISWSIVNYLNSANEIHLKRSVDLSLIGGLLEAFLWSVLFSLRERRVVVAIIKAGLCFFVVSSVLNRLSLLSISSRELDLIIFWLLTAARIAIAATLIWWIWKTSTTWFVDRPKKSFPSIIRRRIPVDSTGRTSVASKLTWIQFHENSFALLAIALLHVGLLVSKSFAPNEFLVHLLWMQSVGCLGVMGTKSIRSAGLFLASAGFKPVSIWFHQTKNALLVSVFLTVLFWLFYRGWDTKPSQSFWFYINACLIAFAFGQFASLFCTSDILAYVSSIVAASISLLVISAIDSYFNNPLIPLVVFAALPLSLVGAFSTTLANTGKLGRLFWSTTPFLFAIALMPLAFQRIYEIPYVDSQTFNSQLSPRRFVEHEKLKKIRNIADQLEDFDQEIRRLKRHFDKSNQSEIDSIRTAATRHLNELFKLNSSWRELLLNDSPEALDIFRYQSIFNAIKSVLGQIGSEKTEFESINQAILNYAAWGQGRPLPYEWLYWWATHPQTKESDLENLINQLDDEQSLFDKFGAFVTSDYWYGLQVAELNPTVFSKQVSHGPFLESIVRWCPWEVARFKRNSRQRVLQRLNAIDSLQKYHQKKDFGFAALLKNFPVTIQSDLISHRIGRRPDVYVYFSIDKILLHRRASKLALALARWQRNHDGRFPSDLNQLLDGYLTKLPVNPIDGIPFYYAPSGLSVFQFANSTHKYQIKSDWRELNQSLNRETSSIAGRPFIWVNLPPNIHRPIESPYRQIKSVDEFETVEGTCNLEIWYLPMPE